MLKVLVWAPLLALAATGCVPESTRGTGRQPDREDAAGESPARPPIKATPAVLTPAANKEGDHKAEKVLDLPAVLPKDADMRLKQLKMVRDELGETEERLDAIVSQVAAAVEQVSPTDFDAQDVALEGLLKLSRRLRKTAGELIAGHEEFERAMERYRGQLEAAPDTYAKAEAYYTELSTKEEKKLLKDLYAEMARQCRDLGPLAKKRRAAYEEDLKQARAALADVKDTARFCDEFEKFAALMAPTRDADVVRRYKQQLRAYATAFTALSELFKRFGEKLRQEAVSEKLTARQREAEERRAREEDRLCRAADEAWRREEEARVKAEEARQRRELAEALRNAAEEERRLLAMRQAESRARRPQQEQVAVAPHVPEEEIRPPQLEGRASRGERGCEVLGRRESQARPAPSRPPQPPTRVVPARPCPVLFVPPPPPCRVILVPGRCGP